jgi:hypothetical protein
MQIKYPDSDNALRSLWNIISFIEGRFNSCIRQKHNAITIFYASSLIITRRVSYNNIQLFDKIKDLINLSPRNFICLIRTTAPSYFHGHMKLLHEQAIDFFRDKCYVVLYDRKREFLNHAKFLIFYHICFSESIVYHGKYYGSTNLTQVGLSYNSLHVGNYEEFDITNPKPKLNITGPDLFYLREVQEQMNHKKKLYTDPNYLKSFLLDHLNVMNFVLQHSNRVISGTSLGELYEIYINLLIIYNQTYALLDEMPGKKLIEKLIGKLMEIKPVTNPFELEVMIPKNLNNAELLAGDLMFKDAELRETINKHVEIVRKTYGLIKEEYLSRLENISEYFDEKERIFLDFVRSNSKYHEENLEKVISWSKVSER